MNERFKFRAWDKVRNRTWEWNMVCRDIDLGSILNGKSSLVPLQYTGLKDKNGVEIYENDVIEKEGHPSYYVSFESGRFVAISTNGIQALNWEHRNLSDMLDLGFTYIGNIYENPELLEASK